ncbi:putative pectinesterase [Lupinus albus]|uniref:Pectinesterase n=1 Tax=Lupinus albus TaxID=3870 RepID=A0A6A4PJ34_LUPAL|nr:putative pectinesterase [Lupinus albus]
MQQKMASRGKTFNQMMFLSLLLMSCFVLLGQCHEPQTLDTAGEDDLFGSTCDQTHHSQTCVSPLTSLVPSCNPLDIKCGVEGVLKLLCSTAIYKEKCEEPLSELIGKEPKITTPKDILKNYLKFAADAVSKASDKSRDLKLESEQEKGAFEDCKELLHDAKEDLHTSVHELGKLDFNIFSTMTPDFNSWLSAVISFQQTCIDGFPENSNLKKILSNHFRDSREFVSNALAIVSRVNTIGIGGGLFPHIPNSPIGSLDNEKFPKWLHKDDRRILKAADDKPTPNVTVAKDDSGDFKTISEALEKIPENYEGRYVVFVKEGVYNETVIITKKMQNLTLYGDGSQKSIITGSKNFRDGVRTFQTASFVVLGEGFIGKAMGFRNTAGPEGHQAVAARVQADRSVFANCRFEGYQDTLYTQTHRQFYRSCVISGTIDFIFGDAAVVFQNCIMNVRKPLDNQQNMVTAQGRLDKQQTTGIVLQKCVIQADETLVPVKDQIRSYLGRPWKNYSRTIVMESEIGDFIHPDGWTPWAGDFALKTLYYAEFNNTGPGANTDARVKWPGYKVINKDKAKKFTVGEFLKGSWIHGTGVPSIQGMYY